MYKEDALEAVSDLNRTVIISAVGVMIKNAREQNIQYRKIADASDARLDALEKEIARLVAIIDKESKRQMKASVQNILLDAVADWAELGRNS
jgi:hypothetical protein